MFLRRIKNLAKKSRGQALVEFCFCLPFLILILVGIIEFGRLYAAWYTIEQACFEGCRLAALEGLDQAAVEARVNSILQNIQGLGIDNVTVTLATVDTTDLMVTVSAEVDILIPSHIGQYRVFNGDKLPITCRHRTRAM